MQPDSATCREVERALPNSDFRHSDLRPLNARPLNTEQPNNPFYPCHFLTIACVFIAMSVWCLRLVAVGLGDSPRDAMRWIRQ